MMFFKLTSVVVLVAAFLGTALNAQATAIIDWDEVFEETNGTIVPAGFQGFDFEYWDEFCAQGDLQYCTGQPIGVGKDTPGVVIGDYSFSGLGFIMKRTDGGLFNLISLFTTNAWCSPDDPSPDGAICSVGGVAMQGYRNGLLSFEKEFMFSAFSQAPIPAVLNFNHIDEFRIWNWAMEGLYVDGVAYSRVPESGTFGLLVLGLAGLSGLWRRTR